MISPTRYIWMDGKLIPWEDARVHVLAFTLHYGLGSFEGIRSYRVRQGQGSVFRLRDHAERLVESARLCNIEVPYSVEEVADSVIQTFAANNLAEGYARPIAFIGSGGMGLSAYDNPVHLVTAVWAWGAYLGEEGRNNGIRCCISSFGRIDNRSFMAKGKVPGHYVNSILAKEEAIRNGYDEALLTDVGGHVLEGSGENLFIVKDGQIFTPPCGSGILGGFTRDSAMILAKEQGLEITEMLFGRDTLYLADEVFLTGTAAEITPVREIDGRTIGSGKPGPITRALQERYDNIVRGASDDHAAWRTPYPVEYDAQAENHDADSGSSPLII